MGERPWWWKPWRCLNIATFTQWPDGGGADVTLCWRWRWHLGPCGPEGGDPDGG